MLTHSPGSALLKTPAAAGVAPRHPSVWRQVKRNRNAYLFIAPFYLMFVAFMLFPIAFSLYLSFFSWNGIMAPRFVGFRHYFHALGDGNLHDALGNTAIFVVITVTMSTFGGLGLALFLNSVRFLKRFYRGVFFVPAIVSLVVVSLVWKLILNSEIGLFNEAMRGLGNLIASLGSAAPEWTNRQYRFLDNPNHYIPLLTITLVNVWAVVGFATVIFLAGLQGIPSNLYEVSHIDGATGLQDFFYITLPLLRPTTFFVVLVSTIDALQVFVLPTVMNRDSSATMTIVYYLYRNAFDFYRMGYASAIAYLLFGITVLISIVIRVSFGRDIRWVGTE
jgi:multiple sugar transport system permease protein